MLHRIGNFICFKRSKNDFYPTPYSLCLAGLRELDHFTPYTVLDPGAGTGVWGKAAKWFWPRSTVTGVELRNVDMPTDYDDWNAGEDFRLWKSTIAYELVVGNPPYKYAEAFIRASMKHLIDGGRMALLLRLAFLEGQERRGGLWRDFKPYQVAVCSKRPSFTGNRKTDATAYAMFYWQKGKNDDPSLSWLNWSDDLVSV